MTVCLNRFRFRYVDLVAVSGHGELIPIILKKSERELLRALTRRPSTVHHSSPINGLTPQHFAVTWPVGLRHLIQAHVDVNAKDHNGRRPIHLAIALGAHESVELLSEADCALAPCFDGQSVLNLALRSRIRQKAIIETITKAFINRHKRLRELALSVLSLEQAQRLHIAEGGLCERTAVLIHKEFSACGIHVPSALELGTESVYEVRDFGPSNLCGFFALGFCKGSDSQIKVREADRRVFNTKLLKTTSLEGVV